MGRIVNLASGNAVRVNRRTLFGRATPGATRLNSQASSKEHACIDWDGSSWILRDLGSRNGTRINELPLADREWRLALGDRVAFGDAEELWQWTEDAGPIPYAVTLEGVEVLGSPTLLALPDESAPEASIYAHVQAWELDDGHSQRPVAHDELVTVGGVTFRLQLPEVQSEFVRTRTNQRRPRLATAQAAFRVSSDEEHVDVELATDAVRRPLPRRAYAYMLLTLARQRDRDQQDGVAADEAGWMYADEFVGRLDTTLEKLNVDIHRVRQLVARLGVFEDPNGIVERRHKQLRIGVGELLIARSQGRLEPEAPAVDEPLRDHEPAQKRLR